MHVVGYVPVRLCYFNTLYSLLVLRCRRIEEGGVVHDKCAMAALPAASTVHPQPA